MLSAAQLAIVATGRYQVAYNFEFILPNGTIRWTTLPYDYGLYLKDNFIQSISQFEQKTGTSENSLNLGIIGTISMLAAFDKCEGSDVNVEIGIYTSKADLTFNQAFKGKINKYGINRQLGKVEVALDITDRISNMNQTNSRLLTPNDQLYRVTGDQCLKFMSSSAQAVFWGKSQ